MRCAVLGSPIEHSLSPTLHRAAYRELGLDWVYDAIEVVEDDLAGFLDGCDGSWRGLSLTMPLKRTVISLLDQRDPLVEITQVANTVVFDGGRRLGYNTDIPGAGQALQERGSGAADTALLLGGGATAASLGWALADLGCRDVQLFGRNPANVVETVEVIRRHPAQPGVQVRPLAELGEAREVDIVVSTIPVVAQDETILAGLERSGAALVFDVVYDPWPTPVAAWAEAAGRVVVNGLDLLAHQAALQVELMTGRLPSAGAMRAAGLAELEARRRA